MPGPYATAEDLADYWRPLSDAELARADVLLGAAGDMIDELPGAANFVATALKWVSLDMVKRAMVSAGSEGVTQLSQAMADMNVNQTFANPMGNLYVTAQERNRLLGYPPGHFSLSLSSSTRVPGEPWNMQNPARDLDTAAPI